MQRREGEEYGYGGAAGGGVMGGADHLDGESSGEFAGGGGRAGRFLEPPGADNDLYDSLKGCNTWNYLC